MSYLNYLDRLFPDGDWPGRLRVAKAAHLVAKGIDPKDAVKEVRSRKIFVDAVLTASDPVEHVLGVTGAEVSEKARASALMSLSTMLLGHAAEVAFENIYADAMQTDEVELIDQREGRTDTDYILRNGKQRKLFRLNIKFFGSYFRRATDLVGLETGDCFPLATYKIFAATKKQEEQHLPYIFLIVGVQDLNAASLKDFLPMEALEFLALLKSSPKDGLHIRDVEDAIVANLRAEEHAAFNFAYSRIKQASWYVLSARRADNLLRELLFERVYAVRVKSFTSAFRNAEVDMHFSLQNDMMPLASFFEALKDQGIPMVTAMLERGTI